MNLVVANADNPLLALQPRFDQLSREIEICSRHDDEVKLRKLVDEYRVVKASMEAIDNNSPKFDKKATQTKEFLTKWCQRINLLGGAEEIHSLLWNSEICQVFLDCKLPLSWSFDIDLVALICPSNAMVVAALLDRGQKNILVYDPEAPKDKYELLSSDGLVVLDKPEQIGGFFNSIKHPMRAAQIIFCSSLELNKEFKEEISSSIKHNLKLHHINQNTSQMYQRKWSENFLNNMNYVAGIPHLSKVKVSKADTAIVIAPGPSLSKNIHLLREVKGKALLISVLHALPALIAEGITPDIVVQVDSYENEGFITRIKHQIKSKIPVFVGATVLPKHYREFPAYNTVWTEPVGSIALALDSLLDLNFPYLTAGTVSLYAFNLCTQLNIKNIILVGQDLAFDGDVKYTGEEGLQEAVASRKKSQEKGNMPLIEVDGYFGGKVLSPPDYVSYIALFEDCSKKSIHTGIKHFNCTEGGAKIQNFTQAPLSQVIKKLKLSHPDTSNFSIYVEDHDIEKTRVIFHNYASSLLENSQIFIDNANICIKISRMKNPSKNQLAKKEEAISKLKKISSQNPILEGFISPLIIKTNRANYGMLNRTSSGAFFMELRSEAFHFRNKLLENIQP